MQIGKTDQLETELASAEVRQEPGVFTHRRSLDKTSETELNWTVRNRQIRVVDDLQVHQNVQVGAHWPERSDGVTKDSYTQENPSLWRPCPGHRACVGTGQAFLLG